MCMIACRETTSKWIPHKAAKSSRHGNPPSKCKNVRWLLQVALDKLNHMRCCPTSCPELGMATRTRMEGTVYSRMRRPPCQQGTRSAACRESAVYLSATYPYTLSGSHVLVSEHDAARSSSQHSTHQARWLAGSHGAHQSWCGALVGQQYDTPTRQIGHHLSSSRDQT